MSEIRVRTAPSPTGPPHIGNTWAALINYLFAKKNQGKFILRLEDTDQSRLVKGSEEKIYEILRWLGLDYDEGPNIGGQFGPYAQSERLEIYKKYAEELMSKGVAFKDDGAVRFKTEKTGKTSWTDLVGNRQIEFDNSIQEDFVILKSDGYPTYHFANVLDDHLMEITHVIRGNEWISSTPKHIMIYQALDWEVPFFAHLPVLLGSDRSKLSKRHGAKSALDYRDDGYLKEALLNFMALLGWNPPSGKEMISLSEMIGEFNFKDVNLASPIFDQNKLLWMNGEYIRRLTDEELVKRLLDYLKELPVQSEQVQEEIEQTKVKKRKELPKGMTVEVIRQLAPLTKERVKKLSDFVPLIAWMFKEIEYDQAQYQRLNIKNQKEVLEQVLEKLEQMEKPWKKEEFEQTFQDLAKELGLNNTQMFQLIRVAISGQLVTPPLFESIQILGEEKTVERIKFAIKFLNK